MSLLLGIDIGTTGTKTLLITDKGDQVATAYVAYGYFSEKTGHVTQNPQDWWSAVQKTVKKCLSHCVNTEDIKAISLSTQGATLVCTDENGNELMPAIVWMDSRCENQGMNLTDIYGVDYFYKKTGWKIANCFNMLQILWLKENNYQLYKNTKMFISTIEYINYKLTGEFVTDETNAGISQLYNITTRDWDEDILNICGLSKKQLPKVVLTGKVIGNLTDKAARELGLGKHVKVISGAQDQYMAAIGSGVLHEEELLLSCGTSWCITSIQNQPIYDTTSYFAVARHAANDLFASFAYTPTGGAALEWVRNNIEQKLSNGESESYQNIDKEVEKIPCGSEGLLFLPHFAGMLFPVSALKAKANIIGLDLKHTRYHIARSVMEGSIFDMKFMLEALKKNGVIFSQLKALGGATKSKVWMQMAADIIDSNIILPNYADIPAVGAAIVAGYGCGVFSSLENGYKKLNTHCKTVCPIKKNVDEYKEVYQKYIDYFYILNGKTK